MANFQDYASQFRPVELEFFAEDELVEIVPNFSLPADSTLDCIGGEYGPFRPNMVTQIPLWMALALHKRKRCAIRAPEWMNPQNLQRVYEEERIDQSTFQELPFYYIEIATLLLRDAKDTFGDELYQVQTLVEQVRKLRKTKIEAGLKMLQGPMTVKMNNLSSMECNMIRPYFLSSLDRYHRHAAMEAEPSLPAPSSQPIAAATAPEDLSASQPVAAPRQLRRTTTIHS
mmetsp:Transcript_19465/g.54172  ORF Transcript_19465/g.54172 Transcript_19465/m.54172 type:complete len:229 (+) Transcript_19465:209-895(+)|eukprot:CAMPEP_0117652462 /NCGR_PEP_ID=MMETSP0804-20121206/2641_1 /TAXON_ID=1074897 /ORGANISM="Tetraselmis astigmatica, Strain CCMP880" /LENGTH=228 /DNA_ID=CAMNT_0005458513 /DNA_START=190 /DNA_END=879 /DNA_ORIENTATION=-